MDPFLGEIRMVGFNFDPRGWAFCNGQLMAISQNTALFSLLGTMYGGDGRTTFALPDLRGRVPVHAGQVAANGLTRHEIGETFGQEYVTLTPGEMPAHANGLTAMASEQTTDRPGAGLAPAPGGSYGPITSTVPGQMVGGNQPHLNIQPSLGVNFVIAVEGIFPSRN
ncbi:hypothetical protein AS189_12105 [Arthrobacter alpinus]|uniref:Phage tail collar domain-containing protein n=1 Tax=Arthrobacter alpinus TaxID=656366 RepID=A0A0S2M090_9MICC|nr:tail fiber protein [Arthrobacter alpinus]ALO67108.1 hypothetical protein AS189_12105 [Arthrobacter alpinus]